MIVKHKVAWPHEAILGGVNRTRVTYDQLTLPQWVQGFCKNILDEPDNRKREKMIAYMADLMEDTTDFTWQGVKGAHAVLCCELEQGMLTWGNSERIDRIRRAHAQKHPASNNKTWSKVSEASSVRNSLQSSGGPIGPLGSEVQWPLLKLDGPNFLNTN